MSGRLKAWQVAWPVLVVLCLASASAQDALGLLPGDEPAPLWRARGEYLSWWSNGNPLPSLVTTSPPGTPVNQAGVLGTPGVQTLYGAGTIDNGVRSGGRLTLTRWLEDDGWPNLEFVGFYVADDYQSGSFLAESDGSQIISRPFFNPRTGQEDAELVSFPNRLAGRVTVASYSEAYSAAGLLRQPLVFDSASRIDVIGGYRYFRFRESLSIREQLVSINQGGVIPLGTTTDLVDRFNVGNDFHGAEVGLAGEWLWDMISVELLAKVALGGVTRHAVIAGNTIVAIPDDATTTTAGGLLALPTNIGSRSSSRFGVLPEINLNATLLVSPQATLLCGYTLVVLNGVIRTGNQIDRNVNPSQIGGGALLGPAAPLAGFDATTLVLHGISFGFDYRW